MSKREERLAILQRVAELEAGGMTIALACRSVGESERTVKRWREQYAEAGGVAGLGGGKSTGRPAVADGLSDAAIAKLREFRIKTGSTALAVDLFVRDELCPESVRERLDARGSRQAVPLSLRRVCEVTPEVEAMHRGPKALQHDGFSYRRDMTELMADGTRRQILAGDWYEFDDMSFNQPYWYKADCPVCGANPQRDGAYVAPAGPGCSRLAHRYGKELGRQSLFGVDVRSGKILGFELVGRARDAYRAEDILRFMRKLFGTWGMPRRGVRLERGIWRSKRIRGVTVNAAVEAAADFAEARQDYERGEMVEVEKDVVVSGLGMLGLEVVYAWSSGGKGIVESSFDHFQSIMNVMGDR